MPRSAATRRASRALNRRSWNAATVAHNSHKGDQAAFLRRGTTLFPEELALLGPLRGRSLLHLQCNSGQDSLSLAARGAQVTGVDLSDTAIAFARGLSRQSGRAARFVRADLYDWLPKTRSRFDLVFSSYGAVGWLDDLDAWARGVRRVLRPGGRFVLVEFHPVLFVFDERWRPAFPYSSHGRALPGEGVTDYVAASGAGLVPWGFEPGVADFKNPHRSAEYAWGLAEILQALIDAELAIEQVREWPFANGWSAYEGLDALPGRRFVPGRGKPQVPMMFGVSARR